MGMWFKEYTIEEANSISKNTMLEHLDILIEDIAEDHIKGSMPVDHRTHQPLGLLHGGASVTLAESLGSIGASLMIDLNKYYPVGIEINANHIRSVKSGRVTGVAKPVHNGKRTHIWQINIYDEQERLVCTSRLTLSIIEKSV